MPTVTPVHPFARFGAGPYSFVSLETSEDREEKNAAAERAGLPFTTNMCGGSCDLCGTAIWNVYTFATAEGRKFKVGCECAEKAGEREQVREAKKARKREQAEESARVIRDVRLDAERDQNEALGHGRLTNDEMVAAVDAARKQAQQARRDASRHIGTVGERMKGIALRYEGHYMSEGLYGVSVLYFLRTVDGDNAVVWKTSGALPFRADGTEVEKGESFTATFTVKSHGSYRDEQQTSVQRLETTKPKSTVKRVRETKAAREQRQADAADRKATEARALKQQALDAAHSRAAVLRDNLRQAAEGHPYYVENADYHRRILALTEAEIAAMQSEMDALG
jgi:hypothetical protein